MGGRLGRIKEHTVLGTVVVPPILDLLIRPWQSVESSGASLQCVGLRVGGV
jgi:hypothetical protein